MAKKKPSKASKKGASTSSINQKYWSNYSIDKLIQQCKSRQIAVPAQKLKRQEYVDKIEESLVRFGDNGPRDWNKLTVEDLKHECSLRNIDTTGLKKQGLLEKLDKGNAKNGGKEPTGPRQTTTQTSNDQQTQEIPSANADRDYDHWDYRTRLLPAWKTLGIKSRKAVDIIQALKDRDKKESAQGGRNPEQPTGAPEPPPGTPEQAAGNETHPAAPGTSPGQAGGQHGATAEGTLASPTSSTGSAFHRESAPPDPTRPVKTPVEALEAARSDIVSQSHGIGISNPSHLCYRNVLFIMLLHCNRLLSWIEHRHIPNLEGAGLVLQIKHQRDAWGEDGRPYTDIWCEFLQLANVYWRGDGTDQSTIDEAMRRFWAYLTSDTRQLEVGEEPNNYTCPFKDETREHDVPQLFEWLVDLSVRQLDSYLTWWGYETTWSEAILNRNVKELMTVYQSVHNPCSQRRRVKHRKSKLEEGQMLRVEIPPARARGGQPNLTLVQCLEHGENFEMDPCTCAPISPRENIGDDTVEANQTPRRAWSKMWYTPEVLFVQLKRFKVRTAPNGGVRFDRHGNVIYEKDQSRIEIPEELDLAPFLEEKGQAGDLSTKYTLVGIVSHQGSRDGGHYITNVRRGDDWQEFDDDRVKKTSLKAVMDQKRRFTPYVLLYERIPEDSQRGGVDVNAQSNADGSEHDDANGNSRAGPSARGDGRARNTRNTRAHNAANRVAKASNGGNKLNRVASNNNRRGGNHPAAREALQAKPSLFTSPYVQGMLGAVFNKLEKYFRKEIRDELVALQEAEEHYREANTRDVLMDYFIRREADMLATQQEQAGQIDSLESYVASLEERHSELVSFVNHVDPAALTAFARKRRREEVYDGDGDLGNGWIPPSKRSKRNRGHTSSMDVVVDSDYDTAGMFTSEGLRDKIQHTHGAYGSNGRLQATHDEIHDADTELPDYVTSEEEEGEAEIVDETDSQSASMSISLSGHEDAHGSGDETQDETAAAPQAQIDATLLEEDHPASLADVEIDYALLMQECDVAKRAFADDYAAEHNIIRGQGPWSWMGPQHQQHFEAQLAEFLVDWQERAYDRVIKEGEEADRRRNQLDTEGMAMPTYTPRSPRHVAETGPAYSYSYSYSYPHPYAYHDSSWRPYTPVHTDDSPSRRFYSIGKTSRSHGKPDLDCDSKSRATPGARGHGQGLNTTSMGKASPTDGRSSAKTTLKHSPQSTRTRSRYHSRILTPPVSPRFRPWRLPSPKPGAPAWEPATPEDQNTWYTPPPPRRRSPRGLSEREKSSLLRKGRTPGLGYGERNETWRFGPQFGRSDLTRVDWPWAKREQALGGTTTAMGPAEADWW
ncbi:hypothetical protein G647_02266 [Cladophialophora carrionii CBS 160.54]|uniref:USP domain-containing protein n=1 Tax=Cladophialophora carrionii CBS 160.54 TaxID=1279043 RepID=V9DGP6_9EURO|nr:uncharacterized protein G647_02266 [Cladophialophora carrionii CBS 160.54]ETI25493.1 hypothetical protein G647_02266 [Cladophialophora carrionii CBS 160.54]